MRDGHELRWWPQQGELVRTDWRPRQPNTRDNGDRGQGAETESRGPDLAQDRCSRVDRTEVSVSAEESELSLPRAWLGYQTIYQLSYQP